MSGLLSGRGELNTTGQLKVGSNNVFEAYVGGKLVFPILKPLDQYTGSYVAYSLRQLTGSAVYAIEVRRDSDNTTQNIGFDISGSLDTGSLLSFVGAGSGYVKTWYNQSGDSNLHLAALASESIREPVIVNSGSVVTTNSKPAISFNGINQSLLTEYSSSGYINPSGLFYTFGVGRLGETNTTRLMAHIDNNSSYRISQLIRTDTSTIQAIAFDNTNTPSQDDGPSVGTNQFISYTKRTSTSIEIYANGSTNGSTSATNPQTLPAGNNVRFVIGGFNLLENNFMWTGSIQEIIHFPMDPSINKNYEIGLNARIRAYYNTY